MAWIKPIEWDMGISRRIVEGCSHDSFLSTIQKIAIYMVVPFALVVFFEAAVKNLVLITLANVSIAILNGAHSLWTGKKGNR